MNRVIAELSLSKTISLISIYYANSNKIYRMPNFSERFLCLLHCAIIEFLLRRKLRKDTYRHLPTYFCNVYVIFACVGRSLPKTIEHLITLHVLVPPLTSVDHKKKSKNSLFLLFALDLLKRTCSPFLRC